jgi:hypothetical protein
MAPHNFNNLSISDYDSESDSDSTVKALSAADSDSTVKPESGAKPNSTPLLSSGPARSKFLGTIIPVDPIYRDIDPAFPGPCSPTLPIPAMPSMAASMSLIVPSPTPTAAPSASSAPPAPYAKASKSKNAQLFEYIHLHYYNKVRPLCDQLIVNAPTDKAEFDAQYEELKDALELGVLYELKTIDLEGDASLINIRNSLINVVEDALVFMGRVAEEQAAVHAAGGQLANAIALRKEKH